MENQIVTKCERLIIYPSISIFCSNLYLLKETIIFFSWQNLIDIALLLCQARYAIIITLLGIIVKYIRVCDCVHTFKSIKETETNLSCSLNRSLHLPDIQKNNKKEKHTSYIVSVFIARAVICKKILNTIFMSHIVFVIFSQLQYPWMVPYLRQTKSFFHYITLYMKKEA